MDISVASVNSPSERLFPSSSSSGDENERIMMAKSGLSHFEWNQVSEELRTIQHHMSLTREHIDNLVERFSNRPEPPQFYISEYSELTSKLHDFSVQEQHLKERLGLQSFDVSTPPPEDSNPVPPATPPYVLTTSNYQARKASSTSDNFESDSSMTPAIIPNSPLLQTNICYDYSNGAVDRLVDSNQHYNPNPSSKSFYLHPDSPSAHLSSGDEFGSFPNADHSNSSSQPSSACVPKSPVKAIVRAHLGDHGHTFVSSKPGLSLKDALSKAMKLRKLAPETCVVFLVSDPEKKAISWDSDISEIKGDEIKVEVRDYFPVTTSISHNFVRKTFFSLAFCEACRRLLFQGFCCRTCGYKFHQKCANGVPKLCQQVRIQKVLAQAMLAREDLSRFGGIGKDRQNSVIEKYDLSDTFQFPPTNVNIGKKGPNSPREQVSLTNRERSTSEPNVNSIIVDRPLPPELSHFRNDRKDIRTQGYVQLDELYNSISSSTSSPSKSSRSVSSSPTSTIKRRERASSADESASKKISKTANKESIEDWEISAPDILCNKKNIGKGSFGTVYRGYWHGPVAVKTLNVQNPSQEQIQAFRNEVALLRKTRHVNVLLFMGCVSSKKILAIVTQWCEASSLYRHIHVDESKFELFNIIEIARQTSLGMDYLHAKNIIHRDLKSNNIFLHDDNFTVKIGDFGLATVKSKWKDSQQVHQAAGSILWMAPEIINTKLISDAEDPFSFYSDVYSFGIVLYELLSGILPYSDNGVDPRTGQIRMGKLDNPDMIMFLVGTHLVVPNLGAIQIDIPPALHRLLSSCVNFYRDQRPLFTQVLANVESIMKSLPKISRSVSEPILHRTFFQIDTLDGSEPGLGNSSTPKTPSALA